MNSIELIASDPVQLADLLESVFNITSVAATRGDVDRDFMWRAVAGNWVDFTDSNDYKAYLSDRTATSTKIRFWYRYDIDGEFVKALILLLVNRFPKHIRPLPVQDAVTP